MGAKIATTQWSQVLAARDGSDTEARRALEELCLTYWQPLYAYIRHQGADPEEAKDLTQGFVAKLLEPEFLADVDPSKGRFRSFLLAAVRNFLSHERDRARALKRGGSSPTLSIDVEAGESGYTLSPVAEMSPADVFERRWSFTVLGRGLERLRREAIARGQEAQFEQLERYLTSAEADAPYREVAESLEMSEGAVATAVHRLRKRFGECLRAEVREIVVDPADVDAELRHMLAVVRPG